MKGMRHLLTFIISMAVIAMAFVELADKCHRDTNGLTDADSPTKTDDTIPGKGTQKAVAGFMQPESINPDPYHGDTLFQYDGKTVVHDYFSFNDNEITSLSHSAVITYRDSVSIDTCMVNGDGLLFADGESLKFAIGVDTVYYNLKSLPNAVSPEKELLPPGVKEYAYNHPSSISDSSRNCDFAFRAYLPDNPPAWLKQFIAVIMRNDINGMYLDNNGADRILDEYYGIKKRPRKVAGLNAAVKSPEEIARYFSKVRERLYRNEFGDEDDRYPGPKHDYMMNVAPAWESSDKKYATYRFYIYYDMMGIHGFMEEYYISFNKDTGAILGFNDLFPKKDSDEIIRLLDRKLTERKVAMGYRSDFGFSSGLRKEELASNTGAIIKERMNSLYYPRPAMTRNGVVFSYQPYEAAAFSDGVVHLLVPYSEFKNHLKIKP